MKENLKPYVYKQREHDLTCDLVLFVERTGELLLRSKVKVLEHRSRRETES